MKTALLLVLALVGLSIGCSTTTDTTRHVRQSVSVNSPVILPSGVTNTPITEMAKVYVLTNSTPYTWELPDDKKLRKIPPASDLLIYTRAEKGLTLRVLGRDGRKLVKVWEITTTSDQANLEEKGLHEVLTSSLTGGAEDAPLKVYQASNNTPLTLEVWTKNGKPYEAKPNRSFTVVTAEEKLDLYILGKDSNGKPAKMWELRIVDGQIKQIDKPLTDVLPSQRQ